MTKAEKILENLPSVKIGLDDHYGKQTVLNALNQALSMSGDVRRSCIDFAEWILKEGFEKYEDNGKCWWGRFKEEDKDYSTEQLYEMWSDNYA